MANRKPSFRVWEPSADGYRSTIHWARCPLVNCFPSAVSYGGNTSMRTIQRLFAISFVALLSAYIAKSWPGPVLNLDSLTGDASLIAVGQITSVAELGKTTVQLENRALAAREMIAELRVDKILKGATDPSSSSLKIHFTLPDEFIGWSSVTPLSYRIFFLRQSSGELQLASPYYPSLVAAPGAKTQEGTAIERVIAELSAAIESPKTPLQERREAVYALDATKDPSATGALKRVAGAQDLGLRLSATAALLHHNDISTLPFSERTLLTADPTVPPDLLHNLAYAIFKGVKDERAIPSLSRLLQASNTEVRRAAGWCPN